MSGAFDLGALGLSFGLGASAVSRGAQGLTASCQVKKHLILGFAE